MSAFSIVETLDVIEDILIGIISRDVIIAINPFGFENSEEALDHGVVVTVASATHAAFDVALLLYTRYRTLGDYWSDAPLATCSRYSVVMSDSWQPAQSFDLAEQTDSKFVRKLLIVSCE